MASLATVAPRMPSAPHHAPPAGACDTHTHVFGPFDRFPLLCPPPYPPPDAPAHLHRAMLASVGIQRGVLVQATPYGDDASGLLAALREGQGSLRGIAAATSDITEAAMLEMHEAGVRGLRFVAMTDALTGGPLKGSVGFEQITPLAIRMRGLGWHAQLWAKAAQLAGSIPKLLDLGVPLVIEHMGRLDIERGVDAPEFRALSEFLKTGQVWIKVVLCRNSRDYPAYSGLKQFHDRLISVRPDRLLWGSDWPFVRMGEDSPDVGRLLDVFHDWVPDAGIRRTILADNPETLYQFSAQGNR